MQSVYIKIDYEHHITKHILIKYNINITNQLFSYMYLISQLNQLYVQKHLIHDLYMLL